MARNRRKLSTAQRIGNAGVGLKGFVLAHWRLFLAVVCIVLITGSLVEAAGVLSSTPHFDLNVVEVVGAERINPDELADKCGLVPGVTNTFALDTSEVRDSCLEDERVSWVEVMKFLPDRVRVVIREASPKILVATENDLVSFDFLGRPIFALPSDWVPGLPVLTGLEKQMVPISIPAPVGEDSEHMDLRLDLQASENAKRMARVEDTVLGALELYATMEAVDPAWLENGVTISWNAASGYEMRMPGRPRLVFGWDGFMEKAKRINVSLSAVALRRGQVEAVYLDNDLDRGSVLLREKEGSAGETAVTRKVDFE